MRRFVLDLPEPAFRTLQALAERERRPVRDQAAVLLERALRRQVAPSPAPRADAPA